MPRYLKSCASNKKRPLGGVFLLRADLWAFSGAVLMGMAWLSASHYRPWINFEAEFLSFTGLGLLFYCRAAMGRVRHWPGPALFLAALALCPAVQYAIGVLDFAGDVWLCSLYLLGAAGAFVIGYDDGHRSSPYRDAKTLWVVILGVPALLSALVGLLQWAQLSTVLGTFGHHLEVGDRPMGNMGQPNQLATLLLLGTCAFAWLYEHEKAGAGLAITAMVVLAAVLGLTQSRAGLLGATVMASYAWVKLRFGGIRAHRLKPWHALVWLAGIWMLWHASGWVNDALRTGANRNISLTDDNSRGWIYLQALYGVWQSPWVGHGWNQTVSAHRAGAQALPGDLTYTYAHSIVVDLLAWVGIPLGLLIACALAAWVVDRAWRARGMTPVLAMAAFLPFAIHSLFEFPYAYAYFLLPACLLAGRVESSIEPTAVWMRPRLLARSVLLTISVSWAGLGLLVAFAYLQVQRDFVVLRFENLQIGRTPDDYAPARIVALTQLDAMLEAARMRPHPGMEPRELDLLRKVTRRFAWGALNYRYAVALALNGDTVGAEREFAVMRAMYGESYYQALMIEFRQLQHEKYPQLAAIRA